MGWQAHTRSPVSAKEVNEALSKNLSGADYTKEISAILDSAARAVSTIGPGPFQVSVSGDSGVNDDGTSWSRVSMAFDSGVK